MNKPIYLDYNATTPLAPEIIEAMRPFIEEHFGNPSSSHWYGREPRRAVEMAREQVAGLLKCLPEEVVFTSGGTEANNHAIQGIAWAMRARSLPRSTSWTRMSSGSPGRAPRWGSPFFLSAPA